MKDALSILQDLIQLDTQNPPGNEIIAVEYIQQFCDELHLRYKTYIYEKTRGNIVVEIGPETHENLIILSHLDVVQAQKEDWSVDPFSGTIVDGVLYGRGTLDMKYFVACALQSIQRLGPIAHTLKKGITFVFSADEEKGSAFGLPRLLQEEGMKEKLSHRIVINEGGGFALFDKDHNCHYVYESGQKSVARIRVKVKETKDWKLQATSLGCSY